MGKNKHLRFAENRTFAHVFQPAYHQLINEGFPLKGAWHTFFDNKQPVTLELGCGKAEYTIGLALMYPQRNFIGMDVKGARFWKGARYAQDHQMQNVAFIRSRIDQINHFFCTEDTINEIWITFPEPQPRESKEKKRLTSPEFLHRYRQFAMPNTTIHLKTDSISLYNYTLEVIKDHHLYIITASQNIDLDFPHHPELSIQTFYESIWRKQGKPIHYISFKL